jgi:hypothetical protein
MKKEVVDTKRALKLKFLKPDKSEEKRTKKLNKNNNKKYISKRKTP